MVVTSVERGSISLLRGVLLTGAFPLTHSWFLQRSVFESAWLPLHFGWLCAVGLLLWWWWEVAGAQRLWWAALVASYALTAAGALLADTAAATGGKAGSALETHPAEVLLLALQFGVLFTVLSIAHGCCGRRQERCGEALARVDEAVES